MDPTFDVFSPQQWRVLQELNIYRFLNVEQMLHLGISKNAKSLRDKSLFALRYHGCIRSERIGAFLPDVHHLTSYGQRIYSEIEGLSYEPAPHSKRQPFSALFARHRFAQVDFHIGFRQWLAKRGDAEIIFELQDFVRNPDPVTKLIIPGQTRPLVPDGSFAVRAPSGQVGAYLVEVHRTTQPKAIYEQLKRYFDVIEKTVITQKYYLKTNPVICSIHFQPSVMTNVKRRLLTDPDFEMFQHNFVFRAVDQLKQDFQTGWHFADDRAANPFPDLNPPVDES